MRKHGKLSPRHRSPSKVTDTPQDARKRPVDRYHLVVVYPPKPRVWMLSFFFVERYNTRRGGQIVVIFVNNMIAANAQNNHHTTPPKIDLLTEKTITVGIPHTITRKRVRKSVVVFTSR